MDKRIGILGAGTIGAGVGRFFATAGWRVTISGAHGPGAIADVAAGLGSGAAAVTVAEAIGAEVVLLATPWTTVEAVLGSAASSWDGRVLIDATNAIRTYAPPVIDLYDFGALTSSEVVAGLAPGARVVKAFNHLPFFQLTAPVHDGERRASFLCGDDDAKADVAAVLEHSGFAPIDLGGLRAGSLLQQVGGPLASVDLRLAT